MISKAKNSHVDALDKFASTKDVELLSAVLVEFLAESSINKQLAVMKLDQEPLWMDPILAYLKTCELHEDKTKAKILGIKATYYVIYDDKLYRRGYSILILRCVTPSKAYYIMREIYEGICGNHVRG